MEGEAVSEKQTSSYTYWVRETTTDAAPLPLPKKLSANDLSNKPPQSPFLGSVWNTAGTWEEKNLNKWATDKIKELLKSISLEFTNGKAEVIKVSQCTGDAFLVTVRNKKRVGYTYELTIDVKGEWLVGGEKKEIKGYVDIPEFSYGELDDLEVTVKINEYCHSLNKNLKRGRRSYVPLYVLCSFIIRIGVRSYVTLENVCTNIQPNVRFEAQFFQGSLD